MKSLKKDIQKDYWSDENWEFEAVLVLENVSFFVASQ